MDPRRELFGLSFNDVYLEPRAQRVCATIFAGQPAGVHLRFRDARYASHMTDLGPKKSLRL